MVFYGNNKLVLVLQFRLRGFSGFRCFHWCVFSIFFRGWRWTDGAFRVVVYLSGAALHESAPDLRRSMMSVRANLLLVKESAQTPRNSRLFARVVYIVIPLLAGRFGRCQAGGTL